MSEILNTWMEGRKKVLISTYEAKGLKASGNFAKTVNIFTLDNHSSMYASPQVLMMTEGRKPNKDQSDRGLWEFARWSSGSWAKQWLKDKGIVGNAFALAYSIGKNGVKVPNAHNDGRLLTDTFTQESKDELFKSITRSYVLELKSDIHKLWQ